MKTIGPKHTIMVGLLFEMLQLMWYEQTNPDFLSFI